MSPTGALSIEERIHCAHVRTLFNETGVTVGTHLLTAVATAGLLKAQTDRPNLLIAWVAAIALAGLARAYAARRYARASVERPDWRTWARIGIAFPALFGVLWAIVILTFFDIHDPVSPVLLTVIPMGLAGAATAKSASVPPAFYAFEAPISAALTLVLIASGTALGYTVGALVLVTSGLRVAICRRLHETMDRALRLGYENLALRKEAERANAAKTRFLAAASHDLRQPIHALGLSFSALAERIRSPETAPLVSQVDACIDAIRQMLEALLDISKLDAGVVKAEPASVDLAGIIYRLESELAPLARQSGNRLRMRTARLPSLRTDPAMLECILRNLIGNALRYTREGKVLVTARRRGSGARIAVRDTGIGIPEDQLDEIFVEFRQLGNPERDRSLGLGLGLAIVKRLAALLDHPIGVQSRPGQGSCFWIDVPRADESAEARLSHPPAEPAPAWSPRPGGTVLVLDDDSAVREAMAALLGTWGYRVLAARTGAEAVELAAREPFDLLVVDYRLPDDTPCAEAIEALQRQRGGPAPVLVVTGDTAPDRLREAQSMGLPLLHKPVKPARLRAALRNLAAIDGAAPSMATRASPSVPISSALH